MRPMNFILKTWYFHIINSHGVSPQNPAGAWWGSHGPLPESDSAGGYGLSIWIPYYKTIAVAVLKVGPHKAQQPNLEAWSARYWTARRCSRRHWPRPPQINNGNVNDLHGAGLASKVAIPCKSRRIDTIQDCPENIENADWLITIILQTILILKLITTSKCLKYCYSTIWNLNFHTSTRQNNQNDLILFCITAILSMNTIPQKQFVILTL